jgi:hypothetical protein
VEVLGEIPKGVQASGRGSGTVRGSCVGGRDPRREHLLPSNQLSAKISMCLDILVRERRVGKKKERNGGNSGEREVVSLSIASVLCRLGENCLGDLLGDL